MYSIMSFLCEYQWLYHSGFEDFFKWRSASIYVLWETMVFSFVSNKDNASVRMRPGLVWTIKVWCAHSHIKTKLLGSTQTNMRRSATTYNNASSKFCFLVWKNFDEKQTLTVDKGEPSFLFLSIYFFSYVASDTFTVLH